MRVWSLRMGEDPLEKGMATHTSILAWRIPWTEEPAELQSIGLQRVGHGWSDLALTQRKIRLLWKFASHILLWVIRSMHCINQIEENKRSGTFGEKLVCGWGLRCVTLRWLTDSKWKYQVNCWLSGMRYYLKT